MFRKLLLHSLRRSFPKKEISWEQTNGSTMMLSIVLAPWKLGGRETVCPQENRSPRHCQVHCAPRSTSRHFAWEGSQPTCTFWQMTSAERRRRSRTYPRRDWISTYKHWVTSDHSHGFAGQGMHSCEIKPRNWSKVWRSTSHLGTMTFAWKVPDKWTRLWIIRRSPSSTNRRNCTSTVRWGWIFKINTPIWHHRFPRRAK